MKSVMKKPLMLLGVLAAAGVVYSSYQLLRPEGAEPLAPVAGAPASVTDKVKQGEYLAKAADCVACHTAPGGQPFAGGFRFNLPFGAIYGTNITADKETGIGNWTDDEFVQAVRKGVSPHGNLYPAMPYTSYTGMSRDDVLAIKAYLFNLPPVKQANRTNELSFPFNQRWGMAFWNLVFFNNQRFVPVAEQDDQLNRGAYLAGPLGHCAECHTPRNIGFGLKGGKHLGGEVVQNWFAGNITPDKETGIGEWSDAQLSEFLAVGHAKGRSSASGPMAEVVQNSTQYLTPEDNAALVKYLRHIAPVKSDASVKVNLQPAGAMNSNAILPAAQNHSQGQQLFAGDCSGCHLWNGAGRQTPYASLKGSKAVNDPQGRSVVQAILRGTHLNIKDQTFMMPDFGNKYSDEEVSAVANYVLLQFGEKQGMVSAKQVAEQRKD